MRTPADHAAIREINKLLDPTKSQPTDNGYRQFLWDGDEVSPVEFLSLLRAMRDRSDDKLAGYVDSEALRVYHPPVPTTEDQTT